MKLIWTCTLALAAALLGSNARAELVDPALAYLGKIKPRSTAELKAAGLTNTFGIGGETTDRGFSTFENWKDYLGPLGATRIRVQSGWNAIETTITATPTYNFSKLDTIVDGVRAQGVEPWVFLGYGNERPGCTNCGTAGLGGNVPTGAGLDRWIKFVEATVRRYNSPTVRVSDWEIWNEPDGHVTTADYVTLITRTAQAIKAIQPNAKMSIGSFTAGIMGGSTSASFQFAQTVLQQFAAANVVNPANVYVSFHSYQNHVDYDSYSSEETKFNALKSMVEGHGFKLRQGESGAPSGACLYYAMCTDPSNWTEANQAKFALRRLLGDFSRGMLTNIFTLTDLHYDATKNPKGLLRTGTFNASIDTPFLNGDQTVQGKKIAYGAYQNVTAIFDSRLQRIDNPGCSTSWGHTVHAYTRTDAGGIKRNLLVVWNKANNLPLNTDSLTNITINCNNFHFARYAQGSGFTPRVADLLDGRVYSLATPAASITGNSAANNSVTVNSIPVGNYPIVISDQGIVLY
ncbi:MAG: cellulase family glycosylhydrolase [Pseudomonadota bacterium]